MAGVAIAVTGVVFMMKDAYEYLKIGGELKPLLKNGCGLVSGLYEARARIKENGMKEYLIYKGGELVHMATCGAEDFVFSAKGGFGLPMLFHMIKLEGCVGYVGNRANTFSLVIKDAIRRKDQVGPAPPDAEKDKGESAPPGDSSDTAEKDEDGKGIGA